MPSLLFEGEDDLKISSLDIESETVKITMCNNLLEAEYSLLEINLSLDELSELEKWIEKQRWALENIISEKKKNIII